MRPRLVQAVRDNGEIVKEFPTTVINENLLSKTTTDAVTEMLVRVVNGRNRQGLLDGTGKKAWSPMMTVAGKTGTADIPNPRTGKYDGEQKLMSFCGFFPAEAPEYTLLVQMLYDKSQDMRTGEERVRLGGGSSSAIAFNIIAEQIMAQKLSTPLDEVIDNDNPKNPMVLAGNINEAVEVLSTMGISIDRDSEAEYEWGTLQYDRRGNLGQTETEISTDKVPDVIGMGAKDAIYLLQSCNLSVEIEGYGRVKSQSLEPGSDIKRGETIRIEME